MSKKVNRTYTVEFKQQSVALAGEIGYTKASRQLGVSVSNIYGWEKQLAKAGVKAAKSKSNKIDYEAEYKKLQKEHAELKKVNTILKAAAAFFSQDHLK
jgi:transposase